MVGGVIRDDKGRINIAFARSIVTSLFMQNVWPPVLELDLQKDRSIWNIEVESDVIQVIQAINEEMFCPWLISILVQGIWEDFRNFNSIICRYYSRKSNKVADYLAKTVHNFEEEKHWVVKVSFRIIQLALENCIGL